jgi:Rrf2 family iron-sulfur cluster assembly transcriptional regulator
MFSKACEYGIRAIIYIAVHSNEGKRISLKSIAKEINSPEAFTAKILQQLVKNDIVRSIKGPNGGFEMETKRTKEIKLSQIVSAIDGDCVFKGCGLGLKDCSEIRPCPLHHQFKKVRADLRNMLEKTSIYELSHGLKKGLTFLKE